eukprot:67222_1
MSSTQTLENLLSVLGQIILIVILGIFTRKFEWLPKNTSSLEIIVGRFALPAIFFSFAAGMNLSSYNWTPLVSMMIAKVIMIILCGFIACVARLKPFFSTWGIMGLFVTQSNDFALGIPVINALWDNDTTHFGDYAVINATLGLFTSSICIAFMLIGETNNSPQNQYQRLNGSIPDNPDESESIQNGFGDNAPNFCKVIIALLRNPLLLALILGLSVNGFCNAIGQNASPLFFQELLHTISAPFNFVALLLMGIGMYGKVTIGTFFGRKALFPFMLVFLKMVVLPVIAREILNCFLPISGLQKEEFGDFENFTFLYGQIPPAVTVVVLARSFNVMPDQMLNGMMMGLILCAPYMFITSLIFGINIDNVDTLASEVDSLSDVMSVLSIITGLLLLSACLLHPPWRRFPMPFVGGLVFCQIMLSLCKLPCNWKEQTSLDNQRWLYTGNVFFRYTSHGAIIVLSILNALYRTRPSLIWNYIFFWKIMVPIVIIMIGCVGISVFWISPDIQPVWVTTYHTFCWLWYQPQFNFAVCALAVYIIVISLTLSISVYYRVVSINEVNKLNETSLLYVFILKRNSSSSLSVELLEELNSRSSFEKRSTWDPSVVSVPATDFNAFYEEQLGIDLCFRFQAIVFCDLIRLSLRFVYMVYIITDSNHRTDQSYYLVHLILAFINDSQAFITFLAFCISEPFWSYVQTMIHILTCGVFRKSNPISDTIAPSRYNINCN